MESGKLKIKNDLRAIRHYGNKAISSRGFILEQDFWFTLRDCHTNVCNEKMAFTLAEILIVLTIIGVMAVMTIPSLMQNSNSQQKITLFKKGFNAISNAYATEFAVKSPPKNSDEGKKLFDALCNQLNVKYFIKASDGEKIYNKEKLKDYYWFDVAIVTEDGIGYRVSYKNENICQSKLTINNYKSSNQGSDYHNSQCLMVAIMLDGKFKYDDLKSCAEDDGDKQDLNNLKCNTLWIPVSKEGITSGNPDCTIAGRIMSDNTTYDENKCMENP